MKDKLLLITLPFFAVESPRYSTVCVHSIVESCGWDCDILDLNVELYYEVSSEYKYLWSPRLSIEIDGTRKAVLNFSSILHCMLDKKLAKTSYSIIAFTVDQLSLDAAFILITYIKSKYPNIFIMIGGPLLSREDISLPYKKLLIKEGADLIISGEVEETLPLFLHNFKETKNIPKDVIGFTYLSNKDIIINKIEPPSIPSINYFYPIDWNKFKLSLYLDSEGSLNLPSSLSRGCPNSCSFCLEHLVPGGFRKRNIESILMEMKEIAKQASILGAISSVYFCNPLINGSISQLTQFCREMIKLNLEIKWESMASISTKMTKELLSIMKQSGCSCLHWGVETASSIVGQSINKNADPSVTSRVLIDSFNCGIKNKCMMMTGFPEEGPKEFVETLIFIHKHREFAVFFIPATLIVLKETRLYKELKQKGYEVEDRFLWSSPNGRNTYEVRFLRQIIAKLVINITINTRRPVFYDLSSIDLNLPSVSEELLMILFALWNATDKEIDFIQDSGFKSWNNLDKNSEDFYCLLDLTIKWYIQHLK